MIKENRSKVNFVVMYMKILFGAGLYALGLTWFIAPAHLIAGGVSGMSMIVNKLTNLSTGTVGILINVPIFLLAFKEYGFKFMASSVIGMLCLFISIDAFTLTGIQVTNDPILASIFGGILTGVGLGIVYSTGATAGGSDILGKFFKKRLPHINFGTAIMFVDVFIVSTYALLFKQFDLALYTALGLYVNAFMVDIMLYGVAKGKLCYIISENSEEIKTAIVETLDRGVTMLSGRGAYSGAPKQVLLCVVKHQQIVSIKKIVKSIDLRAFVIVSDARSVFGEGFTDINYDI